MMTIEPDLAEAIRTALAVRGIEARRELVSLPDYPLVATDLETVVVKLRASHNDAHDEVYWTRILGDGGAAVAPLLVNEVVPILHWFGVATQYLAPDRDTDERDAPAAGRAMRRVHDIAFEYPEPDGSAWMPHDSQPRNFILHQGLLHLVDLNNQEQHTHESARHGAAGDFLSELRMDTRAHAYAQFLDAYDGRGL